MKRISEEETFHSRNICSRLIPHTPVWSNWFAESRVALIGLITDRNAPKASDRHRLSHSIYIHKLYYKKPLHKHRATSSKPYDMCARLHIIYIYTYTPEASKRSHMQIKHRRASVQCHHAPVYTLFCIKSRTIYRTCCRPIFMYSCEFSLPSLAEFEYTRHYRWNIYIYIRLHDGRLARRENARDKLARVCKCVREREKELLHGGAERATIASLQLCA